MKTVLITGARAPVALDLAHSFAAAGYAPHLADGITPIGARLSRFGVRNFHRFASPRYYFDQFTNDLARLTERLSPVLIIPVCEEVFYVAAAAARLGISHLVFAPPLDLLRRLHSKVEFAQICGAAAPQTRRVDSVDGLQAWRGQASNLVFKPEFSRFAVETLVRPAPEELDRVVPSRAQPWAVQDFVAGEELCLWSAAREGRVVAFAAYKPLWRLGRSSSFYFEPDNDPELLTFCQNIAAATNATGQLAFDVIRRPDGVVVPIECNPRGVSGIHLFGAAPALVRAILGEQEFAKPEAGARHLGPAMWLLGAPGALAHGRFGAFRRDLRRSRNAFALPGETFMNAAALLDAARFFLGGLARGRSASAHSTHDIEWNGGAIG